MFNNEKIDRQYRKTNARFITGIVLLALTLCLLVVSAIRTVSSVKNAMHFNDVLVTFDESGKNRDNKIAYLDVIGFYQVAQYGDDLGYYIAYDDDYFYVISIKEKDWDYFAGQFDEKDVVRLWGYTEDEIPVELKEYAIEAMNEDYPDANLSVADFEDVFGDLILKTARDASVRGIGGFFNLNGLLLPLALLSLIFGLIMFFLGLSGKKSFSVLEDGQFGESSVMSEINSPTAEWIEGGSLYLTDNYLVSVRDSVDAVRYSDIFWMYVTTHRTNGIPDYNYLNLVTKDGRRVNCSNSPTFGKKRKAATEDVHTQIMDRLLEKNSEILVGYTAENIEAYNELMKANKEKKNGLE